MLSVKAIINRYMDFIGYERTFGLVLSNIILMLIIYWGLAKARFYPFIIDSKFKKNISIFCIFVFFVFAFWGADWFHVAVFYPQLLMGNKTHMEDIYVWIAQNLAPNYLVFRVLVWGTCLLLVKLIFGRLDIQRDLLWLMFAVFGCVWCSYARVSLSMCLMYFALSVFYKPYKSKFLSYIICISALVTSYFCHKTALFGIAIVVMTMLTRKFNRLTIILLFVSLLIFFIIIKDMLSNYLFIDTVGADDVWDKSVVSAQGYMERETDIVGIGALTLKILERMAYIITAFLAMMTIIKKENIYMSPVVDAFSRLDIIMVVASSFFLFDLGVNTSIIVERFFRFLFIPTSILIAYFWQRQYKMKWTKMCYMLGVLYSSYSLLYSIYMFI